MKYLFAILFAILITNSFAQNNVKEEKEPFFNNTFENQEQAEPIHYDWSWKTGIPTAPPPPPTPVPIDGGLGLLLLGGLGYGLRKLNISRKGE